MQKTHTEPPATVAPSVVATPPAPDVLRSIDPATPADGAGGGSQPTRDIDVELGFYSLRLRVAADVNLDDRFKALCLDTGETLWVNGWLIESHEDVEHAECVA